MDETLVEQEELAGAVIQRCSVNKGFFKNCAEFTGKLQLYYKVTLAKMFTCELWEVLIMLIMLRIMLVNQLSLGICFPF